MTNSPLFSASQRSQSMGLTILRILLGITFTAHGYQKLFTFGLAGIQAGFMKMGAPMPAVTAPLVSCLEFFGGIALVIGLLTRLVALGLAIDMLGAILIVHFAGGFFLPTGYEFVLMLCAASLALAVGGPGLLSVDGVIARNANAGAPSR
jgi:putative oxidoreductase